MQNFKRNLHNRMNVFENLISAQTFRIFMYDDSLNKIPSVDRYANAIQALIEYIVQCV